MYERDFFYKSQSVQLDNIFNKQFIQGALSKIFNLSKFYKNSTK